MAAFDGPPAAGRWPVLRRWLLTNLEGERERWVLWAPAAIGSGIALYFALYQEPTHWLGGAGLAGQGVTSTPSDFASPDLRPL